MATYNMEQGQRDLPRNSANDTNGKDFVQLVNDMIYHEKAKDLELIRTLKEGIVFLRSDIINKQATIDSLLKQLDRLTLAVNCNCQCINNNVNNGITRISDETNFLDILTNGDQGINDDHSQHEDERLQNQDDMTSDENSVHEDTRNAATVRMMSFENKSDNTYVFRESSIRPHTPKPDEVFV